MHNEDPLGPARGILLGLFVGSGIWAISISLGIIVWRALNK